MSSVLVLDDASDSPDDDADADADIDMDDEDGDDRESEERGDDDGDSDERLEYSFPKIFTPIACDILKVGNLNLGKVEKNIKLFICPK
jgi:hypothetical protein